MVKKAQAKEVLDCAGGVNSFGDQLGPFNVSGESWPDVLK